MPKTQEILIRYNRISKYLVKRKITNVSYFTFIVRCFLFEIWAVTVAIFCVAIHPKWFYLKIFYNFVIRILSQLRFFVMNASTRIIMLRFISTINAKNISSIGIETHTFIYRIFVVFALTIFVFLETIMRFLICIVCTQCWIKMLDWLNSITAKHFAWCRRADSAFNTVFAKLAEYILLFNHGNYYKGNRMRCQAFA